MKNHLHPTQRHTTQRASAGPNGASISPPSQSLVPHAQNPPVQRQVTAPLAFQAQTTYPIQRMPVVQRFEPITMGLIAGGVALSSMLGYGGYRYFRHRQRENTLGAITNEQAQNPPTVTHINYGQDMDAPSLVRATNPHAAQNLRNYRIDINQNNPVGHGRTSPEEMRIAQIHEQTHISADQAYGANRDQSRLEIFHEDPTNPQGEFIQAYTAIDNRLQRLRAIVTNDNALNAQQRREILSRVTYAEKPIEYDPVINELLAYTKEYGIRSNSATVKALVILARENLTRRRPGAANMTAPSPI